MFLPKSITLTEAIAAATAAFTVHMSMKTCPNPGVRNFCEINLGKQHQIIPDDGEMFASEDPGATKVLHHGGLLAHWHKLCLSVVEEIVVL